MNLIEKHQLLRKYFSENTGTQFYELYIDFADPLWCKGQRKLFASQRSRVPIRNGHCNVYKA